MTDYFEAKHTMAFRPSVQPTRFGTVDNFDRFGPQVGGFPLSAKAYMESLPQDGLVPYHTGTRSDLHSMYTGDASDIPNNKLITFIDERSKAPSKMKEFKERQAAGEIILNPYRVVKAQGLIKRKVRDYIQRSDRDIGFLNPPVEIGEMALGASAYVPVNSDVRQLMYNAADPRWSLDGDWICTARCGIHSPGFIHWTQYKNVTRSSFSFADEKEIRAFVSRIVAALDSQQPTPRLVTSVLSDANSGSYDLATEIAEIQETVSWIFGLLRTGIELVVNTRRSIKDLRKGHIKKPAAQLADDLASIWMQFRYAFTPLQMSVQDGLDTLMSSFVPYQTYRAGRSFDLDIDVPTGWEISPIETIERCYLKRQHELHVLHNVQFNIAKTAWEVTPLAFVVDWILNIGDLLSALQTPSNVVQQGCQSSWQVRKPVQITTPEGVVSLDLNYYRVRPIEPILWVGLGVEANMSWKRWIDAIALSWGFSKSLLTKSK